MLVRIGAARLRLGSAQKLSIPVDGSGSWDEPNAFRIQFMFVARLEPILRGAVRHLLQVGRARSWHFDVFRQTRPLEFCASMLLAPILSLTEMLPTFVEQEPPECNLGEGPGAKALSREAWLPVLKLLLNKSGSLVQARAVHLAGEAAGPKAVATILVEVVEGAQLDVGRESWLSLFWHMRNILGGLDKVSELLGMRRQHFEFSQLCRLFALQWVAGGVPGKRVTVSNERWEQETTFLFRSRSTYSEPRLLKELKEQADSIARRNELHRALGAIDWLHWPQPWCAAVLLRIIFTGCRRVLPEADADWASYRQECDDFSRGGRGPWRVTGFLLRRLAAWVCAARAAGVRGQERILSGDWDATAGRVPQSQERKQLIGCLSHLAEEEHRSQTAWMSVLLPLADVSHAFGSWVWSDESCLAAAKIMVKPRPGSEDPKNPAERVRAHALCSSDTSLFKGAEAFSPQLSSAFERLRNRSAARGLPDDITCPGFGSSGSDSVMYNLQYFDYSREGACSRPRGMWKNLTQAGPATRCKYGAVARLFGLGPGSRVLDVGAGCGHHLHLLSKRLGVLGVAVELLEANVAWGRRQLGRELHAFCAADATSLGGFLSNGSFDAVVSNAVLRELPVRRQCEIARSSVRLLAPGGCAWFGWLGLSKTQVGDQLHVDEFPASEWSRPGCLGSEPGLLGFFTAPEEAFFGAVEYAAFDFGRKAYSLFICKDVLRGRQ
eukprot:TRINITY_DN61223_c0_g1_i1.p1 TRINITY_DN61223_c0_g1~~TRINITY_DN61223_c0_g1_i1.p1  ORF type:complete len:722 (-),score=92.05 TRINITY_DN61223_c0_g1_i1:76-2241(-)